MKELLAALFSGSDFMPHGHCYLWTPGLVWLHVIADALVVLAYYSIPIALIYFVRKRTDIKFGWMFLCFAIFILACGTTHLMEIWNVWHAHYWLSGSIKALTALASVPTAILLVRLVPVALALPSPAMLARANAALEDEIETRRKAEERVRELNAGLEVRVAERTLELNAINAELMRQIAERRRDEQSFRESEERTDLALRSNELKFRRLLDSNILGVIFWNLEGDILDANDLFLEMVGYTREDLREGRLNWKKLTPPESIRDDEKAVDELKARGTCTSFEKEYIRKDGSRVSVLIGSAMLEALVDTGSSFVMDITERKQAARQIERYAEQFRALSHRLLAAQEEERRHLARELHDEIGQTLTAAKLNLKIVAPEALPAAADRIEDSIQLLDRLLGQVRQLSLDLRPPLLDELGLVPALRWLTDQQAQRARLCVAFSANVEGVEMDPPLRTACFRVAQEAITNAIRHAQAATVAVELRAEPERVWLVVHDDGVGFDKEAMQRRAAGGASIGLLSMNERVSLLGGELEVQSAPREGTLIRAWFPLAAPGSKVTAQSA